jgi:hypothetical protein
MRRTVLTALCATALLAAPAHAAPRPAVLRDAKGDWSVAGQDLLAARISGVRVNGVRAVRAEVDLADVPTTGSTYGVLVETEACGSWGLVVSLYGTAEANASFQHFPCPATGIEGSDASMPATFSVTGKTLTITAPYGLGLGRGARLVYGIMTAATYYAGLFVGPPVDKGANTGDIGGNGVAYVLP